MKKVKSLYYNKEKKIWETEEDSPYFKLEDKQPHKGITTFKTQNTGRYKTCLKPRIGL